MFALSETSSKGIIRTVKRICRKRKPLIVPAPFKKGHDRPETECLGGSNIGLKSQLGVLPNLFVAEEKKLENLRDVRAGVPAGSLLYE